MSVVTMAVGATTPDGATFGAKVDGGGPVRVAVADNAGMSGPVFTASQAVTAEGWAKVSITGLDPATRYWWQAEDASVLDTTKTGQFSTHPPLGLPGSFTMVAMGDAGLNPASPGDAGGELDPDRVSNHPVFATLANRATAEGWLMGHMIGDWGYPDWSTGLTDTLANRRTFNDDNLRQPNQATLRRLLSMSDLYDDHDFGPNNSDGTYVNKSIGAALVRERFCHYPLPDPAAIYWSRPVARTLIIGADVRHDRSPNSDPDGPTKTMLGSAQKAWMQSILSASDAELLIWLMPQQWMGTTAADSWASFQTEQAELIQMFGDLGWLGRMRILGADAHMVALDSGANSPGGIPVLQCAALDASPLGSTAAYDHGGQLGRNQYGTITVQDLGSAIQVELTGWEGTTELVSLRSGFITGTTAPVASGALLRTLTGTHTPTFEARVVTGHPTGDDPGGTEIKILSGDVTYDATAEIRASLKLETLGVDEGHGRSAFPRFTSDLLAPFGAEVFVRYGLNLGTPEPLWTPLGYFRVQEDDQADAPYGGIVLSGQDRMARLVEAILLSPRIYQPENTYGFVVDDLVRDVYPAAVIVWDDDSDQTSLGRVLVVEESRTEALRDIANSAGKIMYWDDEGALRFEAAPDESVPLWEVRSGRDGVLVRASRRVTRRGVANAIILVGQAADDQPGVRAVVFDNNPASPTFFFGEFGQVPAKHESVLVNNFDQAHAAALALLRRSLGAPYEVDFAAVTNPTLRPWQPVRVTQRDGNRDVVVMQRVTIPLGAQPMSGTARSSIVASVGSLT